MRQTRLASSIGSFLLVAVASGLHSQEPAREGPEERLRRIEARLDALERALDAVRAAAGRADLSPEARLQDIGRALAGAGRAIPAPVPERELRVELAHFADATACEPAADRCSNPEHWQYAFGGERHPLTRPGLQSVHAALVRAAEPLRAKPGDATSPSNLQVVVTCRPQTPWELVQRLLQEGARAGVWRYRIETGLIDPAGRVKSHAIDLPRDAGGKPPDLEDPMFGELRILIAASADGQLQRVLSSRPIPAGPTGDALLEELLRGEAGRREAAGKRAAVVVDAGRRVAWTDIAAAMDLARRAGVDDLHFAIQPVRELR